MQKGSLRQLYVDELRNLYSAEIQMVKALPILAKAASNVELREAYEEHLRQTSDQISRLEEIFKTLEEKPSGRKCLGMGGLVKESAETMEQPYENGVMDIALIGVAQRIEHFEIAGYGALRMFANLLGENEHVSLIEQTFQEEKQTDGKLSELAERINLQAAQEREVSVPDHPGERKSKSSQAA